jgi:hypothetical protein
VMARTAPASHGFELPFPETKRRANARVTPWYGLQTNVNRLSPSERP